jgi:hypothetical protein
MKILTTVPESITHEAYKALVAGAGFEVRRVRKLEFRMDGIYAEVYDCDPEGRIQIHKDADDAAVNRVWIPVRD